jgi:PKD repeat protein
MALLLCTSFAAEGDVIIDNGGIETSFTGTWEISGGSNPYGADSVWARDGATYTWGFDSEPAGTYEVLMWWSTWPSRATAIDVSISHADGSEALLINQQAAGGRWNSMGEYYFDGSGSVTITAAAGETVSTCADAVWFRYVAVPAEVIVDNRDGNTARTGTWEISGGADPYGADSVWSRDGGTFTWYFTPAQTGSYEVSMWWTQWPSRSTAAPIDIVHADGTKGVTVNQQTNGGRWNSLGVYTFGGGLQGFVRLLAQNASPTSYCADAVKFTAVQSNEPPVAVIDSVQPNPAALGQVISFAGHGTDADGTIATYSWESSIDGLLSNAAGFSAGTLSEGTHEIALKVQDNTGQWSQPAVEVLTVSAAPAEIIIDNRDGNTAQTGTWEISGGADPYGVDSVWSRDGGTFTWYFTPSQSGDYEVSMWWTQWASRSTAAPVDIVHANGTERVTVNQQVNGGRWNVLGAYTFEEGVSYSVRLSAENASPTSYCADAVKFAAATEPAPVADFYADRFRGAVPFTINFTNQTDGDADQWRWDFGDGQTSSERSPSHRYTTPGVHTVSLTATNRYGTHTKARYSYVDIKPGSTENIYVCDGYGGNDFLVQDLTQKMREMNTAQTADGWVYRPANSNMTYNIHILHDKQAAINALYETNAHVVIGGHANYGFGLVFATSKEILDQKIDDFRYVDDDRLLNYSTDSVSTKVDGMKYGQAYPNWEPVFKDGRSALMPYDFGDPRGNPPYNYYVTYQLPNDPTNYRIEINGNYLERYSDSGVPAWYSPQGLKPDRVNNPEFFIRNPDVYYNRFDHVGEWVIKKDPAGGYSGQAGYMGYNYQVQWRGSGSKVATWTMVVKQPGQYRVLATWPAYPENATNARYTIRHAGGSSVVLANQASALRRNSLGVFNFNAGVTTVELNDNANGQVIADAMVIRPVADAEKILRAEFSADAASGPVPLTVNFQDRSEEYNYDYSTDIAEWRWDFGDGTVSNEEEPSHTYVQAGAYTVTLRIVDTAGFEDTETKTAFIAAGATPKPQAQFRSSTMRGTQNTYVNFYDQSSGDINQWSWDFGDGGRGNERNPVHNYTAPGTYTVRLTVSGPGGSGTEIEENYMYNFIGESYTDNTFQTKPHFYQRGYSTFGKVICYAGASSISKARLGYARLFHGSCGSFPYFGNILNRGVMYGKGGNVEIEHDTGTAYLEYYLLGYTDMDIVDRLNELENLHEFYNFTEKPPSMQ